MVDIIRHEIPANWYNQNGLMTIMAPMVGQSDIGFRLLCRKYGVSVCFSEMLIASRFCKEENYRIQALGHVISDHPLVVQFATNSSEEFLQAALYAQAMGADGIDLNLGCPQRAARVAHVGAYLTDPCDWGLCQEIINKTATNPKIKIPISAKIRLQNSVEATVEFAKLLAKAGASMITVHGRKRGREDRRRDGSADLEAIKLISESLQIIKIPVVTNGNVREPINILENLRYTQAKGIMIAEQLLRDPAIFERAFQLNDKVAQIPSGIQLIQEYIDFLKFIQDLVPLEDDAKILKTGKFERTIFEKEFQRYSVWWSNAEVVKSHFRYQLELVDEKVSEKTFTKAKTVQDTIKCFYGRFNIQNK